MSSNDAVYYKYSNLTASAQVQPGIGKLGGIICASQTAGTVKVWDSLDASGSVVLNTMSLEAGKTYALPAILRTGLFVTIGGTADITVFYL